MLQPYAHQLVVGTFAGWVTGSVALYLGMLATAAGDWADADARFAAAAATHESIDAPAWLARTRLEWARMLRSRAEPGDDERADRFLGQAIDSAREMELANIERQAAELLASR
jgi:hypothetical protein